MKMIQASLKRQRPTLEEPCHNEKKRPRPVTRQISQKQSISSRRSSSSPPSIILTRSSSRVLNTGPLSTETEVPRGPLAPDLPVEAEPGESDTESEVLETRDTNEIEKISKIKGTQSKSTEAEVPRGPLAPDPVVESDPRESDTESEDLETRDTNEIEKISKIKGTQSKRRKSVVKRMLFGTSTMRPLKGKEMEPIAPDEPEKCTQVTDWLNSCPDDVSMVSTDIVLPSIASNPEVQYPAIQTDHHQSNMDIDSDFSEIHQDLENNMDADEVSLQDAPVVTPLESLVKKAVSRDGAIVLDKHQFCYYCKKPQLKLARHMTTIHKTELFVARLLAVKGTKPDVYHKGLKRLKCLGNFVHNVESLRENKNDIVVVKRPSKVRNVNEYLPCIHCYGFYVVDELWKHTKQCDLQTVEKDVDVSCVIDQSQKVLNDSNIVQQSKFLLDSACVPDASTSSMSDQMRVLVNAMHEDELVRVVSKDKLLLLFGETLLNKYGPTKKNDIAQRLRQLARLLLKCRDNLSDDTLSYFDVLCGKMFDACIEGTFNLCGMNITNDGRREFQTPSLALRLGHLLKKLGAAKQGFCLRNDDLDGLKEAESFGKLLQSEWTDTVATNAHNTLKRRKDQSVQLLPITEDLRSLRTYQMKEMRQCIDSLQDSPDYSTWRKLAQLTMTRMTIFNKRRGGEVSKMLLETYKTRPDWKSLTNEEVMRSLQPMERTLLKRLDLVQIPGKKSRKVPMLITDDVKEGIDMLNLNRDAVGIPSTNPFCFASKSSSGHLDNWQAMNLISQEASVKHPELITSTKLRKYNATVSQLFDLNQGELEWLSNHMGHDLNIHKDFYRLHDSTIEMAKVSRLLMAVDSGKAAEFVGKKLTDINLNDFHLDGIENEDKERMKTYVADNETDPTANVCTENVSNSGDDQSELLDAQNSLLKGNRRSDIRNKITTNRVQKSDSESHGMELTKIGKRSASNGKGYHSAPRKRKIARYVSDSDSNSEDKRGTKSYSKQKSAWSHREIQILKTEFAHHLKQGIYPSGKQIHRAININTCLKNRTVLNVRAKLQHLMRKKV